MLQNDGHWLKLMRSATLPSEANICICISGSNIVCSVIQEICQGVELLLTCYLVDKQESYEPCLVEEVKEEKDLVIDDLNESNQLLNRDMLDSTEEGDLRRNSVPVASCEDSVHCKENSRSPMNSVVSPSVGKTNSSDEMEEHQNQENVDEMDLVNKSKTGSVRLYRCPLCSYYCYREHYLLKHMEVHETGPRLHSKEGSSSKDQSSFCVECNIQFMSPKTYQVHKQIYCKARREVVQNEVHESYSRPQMLEGEPNTLSEDVFVVGKNSLNGIPPVIQPQAFFAAISTNPLILLPCSLLNAQNLLSQNGIVSTGAPIILPGGITGSAVIENNMISLHPGQPVDKISIETDNRVLPPVPKEIKSANKYKPGDGEVLNLKKQKHSERKDSSSMDVESSQDDAPLDLTTRKRKQSFGTYPDHHLVKRKNSTPLPKTPPVHLSRTHPSSPELTHAFTRVTGSPISFSNDVSSSSGVPSHPINSAPEIVKNSEAVSPDPPVLTRSIESSSGSQHGVIPIGIPPPRLLKQGNNKCEDCNIVFYKYDNYLAHKRHYCAFRRRQLAVESLSAASDLSSADDNSNHAAHDPASKRHVTTEAISDRLKSRQGEYSLEGTPVATSHKIHSAVFACEACGVKFSTADNLNAHQTYYCSRKLEASFSKVNSQGSRRNSRCLDLPCEKCGEPLTAGHEELCCQEEWKCNYCDLLCPSIKTARRHLLTHSEVRGFCCIVCGYRGNTLRGMRTHVYEHLNGNQSQIEDILESSIVVDSAATSSGCSRGSDYSDEEENDWKLVVDERTRDASTRQGVKPSISRRDQESLSDHSNPDDSTKPSSTSPIPERANSAPGKKSPGSDCTDSRTLHPETMCDVVIKTEEEEDDSAERILPERETPPPPVVIKEEPDAQKPPLDRKNGASVICRTSTQPREPSEEEVPKDTVYLTKKKSRQSELKYCKSCEISFNHLSNYLAHKKFYCVSRVIGHFQQETAPVQ